MRRWKMALGVGAIALTGCNQLLLGGLMAGQALAPISEEQEIAIGRSAAQEVLQDPKTPAYTNSQVTDYVTRVGRKVAARSERSGLPFEFRVIRSEELNAFALPGGQIFVTTAALQAMKSEAELAGVLGHEVTHVSHQHGIEQLRRAMVAQGIAIAALGSTPQLVQQAGKIALQLVLNGYGRALETESDRYGAVFSNGAGYDPQGLASFLQTLMQKYGDTPKAFEPLSDHPRISERITAIGADISQLGLTSGASNSETYLSMTAPLR